MFRFFKLLLCVYLGISVSVSVYASPAVSVKSVNSSRAQNAQDLFGRQTLSIIPCNTDDDCVSGCMCFRPEGSWTCIDKDVIDNVMTCKFCVDDSECPRDTCDRDLERCESCVVDVLDKSVRACSAGSGGTGPSIPVQPNPVQPNPVQPNPVQSNPIEEPCVETEWLKNNGFSHGILEERKVSKTVCIDGLPCGTEGHLLRECSGDAHCHLVPYKQICQRRGDCEVKYMKVSRLSAKIDWSVVKMEPYGEEDGTTVSLTSLSVKADGGDLGFSYLIAWLGEKLISRGFGRELDIFILSWDKLATHAAHMVRSMDTLSGEIVTHDCRVIA